MVIVPTEKQIELAFRMIETMTETIKDFGEISNSVLYSRMKSRMDEDVYNVLLNKILLTGYVVCRNDLLIWKDSKDDSRTNHPERN